MKYALLVLMLLIPNYSKAKTLQANGACVGLVLTPKLILEKLYDNVLYNKILKRINREIEDKVISKELAEMLKHIVRDEKFKDIVIREGRAWCNER